MFLNLWTLPVKLLEWRNDLDTLSRLGAKEVPGRFLRSFVTTAGGMAGPTNPTCGPILLAEKEVTGRTLRAHAGSMAGPPSVFDQGASLRLGLTSRRGVTLPLGAKGSSRSFFSALS